MRKKVTILWTIMLVVGTLSVLPMTGSAATPHEFEAWSAGIPQIINATDMTHPNDGLARMYALARPAEVAGGTLPDPMYPGTSDLVGANGFSLNNNSFQVDTANFGTDWTDGEDFIFIVERDPGSSLMPQVYETGTVPNGYVASPPPVAIDGVLPKQPTGAMTLEKIPQPYFSTNDPAGVNYTVNWTVMTTPNIMTYMIFNSSAQTGPWTLVEEVATPPSTVFADSGKYYALGINWIDGVPSLVLGTPRSFNTEPTLDSGVVTPNTGPANCRDFEFMVTYTDTNNDPPQAAPRVYINVSGGAPVPSSPFTMTEVDPLDTDYTDGKLYRYPYGQFTTAGTYTYYFRANDSYGVPAIGPGTAVTTGPTVTTNTAPTITVDNPLLGMSWTGGSSHDIVMSIVDPDDSAGPGYPMTLYLNYSVGGGPFTNVIVNLNDILSGLSPYNWNPLPNSVTSSNVVIRARLTDSCGVIASDDSAQFEIDSTKPTVQISPANGATGVALATNPILQFSEGMDTPSAQGAVTFIETVSGTAVPYTAQWNGNSLELVTSDLKQYTQYTVSVAATARDDSDPGNNLTANTSIFRTVDTLAPVITLVDYPGPSGVPTGTAITITANVTDIGGSGVDKVNLSWGFLGVQKTTLDMTLSGNIYTATIPAQTTTGTIEFIVGAIDVSTRTASSLPTQFIITGDVTCSIHGNITDADGNGLGGVKVEVLDGATVVGSATTDSTGYYVITGLPCGSYTLKISKTDYDTKTQSVNTNTPDQGSIQLIKTTGGTDFPWWIIIVLVIVIVVILLLVLLMKRKKPAEEEAAPEEAAEEEEMEEEAADEEMVEEEAEEELGEEETEEVEEELEEEEDRE